MREIEATVKFRRGGSWVVKASAEQVDGVRHSFLFSGDSPDGSIYSGEVTWSPVGRGWPDDAPLWIADGDLVDVVEVASD